MSMRKAQDRALHYGRAKYKPGLAVCRCDVCKAAEEAAREAAGRGEEIPRVGSPVEGCEYVNYELAFAEAWEKECRPSRGINYGYGLVQDLMVVHKPRQAASPFGLSGGRMAFWLTTRERVIAATVVQWLGTNCGMCFLREVLQRCGLLIVQDETQTDRYKGLKDELEMKRREGRQARGAFDSLLQERSNLLDRLADAAGASFSNPDEVVREVKRLVRERDEARAVLARLNLDPHPVGSVAALGRFATLDDGGLP